MDNLQNLEELYLANNPLLTFESLYNLNKLNSLKILSLNEPTFGKCGVVDNDGYEEFVIKNVKNIVYLDNKEISDRKKQATSDDYKIKVCLLLIILIIFIF